MAAGVTLYSYWRSQASYRVRIALALKGVAFETVSLDLLKGDQAHDAYRALNPGMAVPTLIDGDGPPLVQSLAILEYIDERDPHAVRGLRAPVGIELHRVSSTAISLRRARSIGRSGESNTAAASTRQVSEIGRSRKIQNRPSDRIIDLRRLFSISGPSTKARTSGAGS